VIYHNDPELICAPDGVLEVLTKAKQQGKVRFVGFQAPGDSSGDAQPLNRGYAFDTAEMPLNPLDPNFRSFESNVLPVAHWRGIAVLGIKSMGGSGELISKGAFTPSQALTYAMSLPVATTIRGKDSMEVLPDLTPARGSPSIHRLKRSGRWKEGRQQLQSDLPTQLGRVSRRW
jgi:aryl-alcohol dehydrogenase-like predicted oxidoreductase